MRFKKFEQLNTKKEYYIIYHVAGREQYSIPPDENDYETNYDAFDLEDCVRYVVENEIEYYKIVKFIEEEIPKKDLEMY